MSCVPKAPLLDTEACGRSDDQDRRHDDGESGLVLGTAVALAQLHAEHHHAHYGADGERDEQQDEEHVPGLDLAAVLSLPNGFLGKV